MRNRLVMILLVFVTLMTARVWAQSYPVADTFSGSGALSSNWTNTTAGNGLSYPPYPLVQASGEVVPNTANKWGLAIYTGTTFTANQYAQVKFVAHSSLGGGTGPCVAMSVGGTGYCYAGDDGKIVLWYIGDRDTGQPVNATCPIPATGDIIQLSKSGSTLTCSDITTGVSASATEPFSSTGNPGVLVDRQSSSVYALTSFQADCVPTCNTSTPAATPTFSPVAGTYTSAQTVTISDSTSGATIYYTTNGTTPTTSSSVYSSPISVSTSETVKAIATASGYTTSAVGSAVYTINTSGYPVADTFSGSGALSSNWTNTTAGNGLSYPPVPLVQASGEVVPNTANKWGLAIYTGTTFTANQYAQVKFVAHSSLGGGTGPCVAMSVGGTGYCYAGDDGKIVAWYTGDWDTDDPVNVTCPIPATGDIIQLSKSGSTLTCSDITTGVSASGTEPFSSTGNPGVLVDTRSSSVYALTSFQADCVPTCGGGGGGTVATPTFSPIAGTYGSAQTVTISDSTSGATLHYTTNGSTPTASSTTYTAPINVSTSETVKAIGVLSGYTNSAVGSAAYTISLVVATPTFSPGAGTYSSAQTVTISDLTSSATIHYTTDGSTPTANSTTYSAPITVSTSETVQAIGVLSGYTNSQVGSAAYTIGATAHNWYVRPDGGTRYSTNVTNGQCNGMADAPYPGSGTNQNCAFNDVRYLWQDGTQHSGGSNPGYNWIIAGGDTVTIRGSIADGVSYRIGWQTAAGCGSAYPYFGLCGDFEDSGMPSPPSGTPEQHTIIRGGNYASCTSQSARTQLHGGYGVTAVINMGTAPKYTNLNLSNSDYVDLECLDITDFAGPGGADKALSGIVFSTLVHDVNLNDISAHGLADNGFYGSTSGNMNATDIQLMGNGSSGWNTDLGNGKTGTGAFNITSYNISWNGCIEEYPIVDPLPYTDCHDDVSGGYGDGFGTASVDSPAPGWQVHLDQGTVSYNTSDGLDALHIAGPGSTMTVTRTLAFGNMGNQVKVGGATATIQNSVIVGNCRAMSLAIPGTPSGYNSNLSDFCRPDDGDTAIVINVTPGDPAIFQDNTIFSEGKIGLEVEYETGDHGSTNTLKYNNNIFVGFDDPETGENPTPIYSNSDLDMLTNPGASWTNNSYFGYRSDWTCPYSGESEALCSSPELKDMTYHSYGYGNMAPASDSSPVVGAGVTITGITTDYKGTTRANPPTIGACETTATCP